MIFKTTDDGERIISFFKKAKIESKNFAKQLEKDKIFLTEYFNATGDVAKQQAILNQSTNEASKNAIGYAVSTKGAAGSVSNFEQQQVNANASVQISKKYFDLSTVSVNAYKLAIKGITIVANIATTTLLSGVVYAFSKLFTAQNEAIEKAKELTSTYKSNNTSLENYKEQINLLVTELNTSNMSYEDSITKRKELMFIQEELFKKYGTEEEVIKSITSAINGEVDALDNLSQKSYYEWLASVDTLTDAQKSGNGFFKIFTGISNQYKSALDSAVDYMENKTQFFYIKATGNEELDKLIQEKFNLSKNTFNELVIKDMVPEEAYELLGQIRTAYRDNANEYLGTETDNILTNVNNSIQSAMTTINAELDKHQETYHTYLEGMIKYDSEYSDEYADLLSKRALLEDAESSTNDEGKQQRVLQAKKSFYDSLNNAIVSAENNDNVKRYFENLYPELYSEISSWNFEYSIYTNTNGINDIAKEIGEKYTAADLFNMVNTEGVQEGEESFNSLIDKAIEYGVCTDKSADEVQKLIDLLVELGIIQDNIKSDTFSNNTPTPFPQAWTASFTSDNESVRELGNTLLELAEQGRLTIETFNNADSSDYFKNLGISADEAVSKINRMADESQQLSSMANQISSMSEALDTKQAEGFVSADVLSGFDAEVRGLESWDKFQTFLGSVSTSYDECQEAASALASEWINNSDFLAQLTEENKEYYATQLEAMGIENYEEIISYAQSLNEAKEALAQANEMSGEATQDEIEALIAEGAYSELTAGLILQLYDAKIAEKALTLDTSADCEELIALAGDADKTSRSIQLLLQLKDIYNGFESGIYDGNRLLREEALAEVDRIKGELEELANGESENSITMPGVTLGNKGTSAAKSAGQSAGDAYVDAFEKELEDLKDLRDRGTITEKAYLDEFRRLYQRYYRDKKKYAEEYAKYEHEYLQGMKSLYESALSGVTSMLDKQIGTYEDQKSAAVDSLEAERDARIEVLETQKEQYEEQIKLIDEQIEAKEKIIDGINEEIDAIKDANEQRKREIDLEKSKYELERMMNQRTILQYSADKGMHYTQDTEGARNAKQAVEDARDAKQAVEDAELEIEIAGISGNDEPEDLKYFFHDKFQGKIFQTDFIVNPLFFLYNKVITNAPC